MVSPNMYQEQTEKAIHVVQCISQHSFRLADQIECFRRISQGLEQGDSLKASPLTGGLTNFSYKVYLEESTDVVLFAKLSFPYALWNPDKTAHYDVGRTRSEFEMMKAFAQIAPSCVPTPYVCEPVEDMMVLVTEWCDDDEQLARQVIDGHLDPRICSVLARSVAKLHCMDFDRDFNTTIRTTMISTFTTLQNKLETMLDATDDSRAALMVQGMGRKNCQKLVDHIQFLYENTRDCLVHSDLHVKNILVERRRNTSLGENWFGPTGTFSVVDWEMAFAGPVGRDLGTLFPFPLCCALAHALGGNMEGTINLLNALESIWEEYSRGLRDGGKDEEFINHAFRSIIGWCGRFMFLGFYTSGVHVDDFPINNCTDRNLLLDSIGVLALNFMKSGFNSDDDHLTTTQLLQTFRQTIWQEIAFLVSIKAPQKVNYFVPTVRNLVDFLPQDTIESAKSQLVPKIQLAYALSLLQC